MKDLAFKNGIIDENYLYTKIRNKRQIFRQITILRQALKPFKTSLRNHVPNPQPVRNVPTVSEPETKSKYFYNNLIQQKIERPKSQAKIRNMLNDNNINFDQAYLRKIKQVKEYKLAEFNYKVLHDILPCQKKLKLWDKANDDTCDVCPEIKDMIHLLIKCPYAKAIWTSVEAALDIEVTAHCILLGHENKDINFIISLIAFLIYKEWLLCNKNNAKREHINTSNFLSTEIRFRRDIYNGLKWQHIVEALNIYLDSLS